jgi:DNA polymerase sigma
MSEDTQIECTSTQEACKSKAAMKKKRDIFRFKAEEDMSINLEHMNKMTRKDKRITFQFSETADYVEFESEEIAQRAYEQILNIWVADVLE